MPVAWIALGSNLNDPPARVRAALEAIRKTPRIEIVSHSGLYRSAPIGPRGQADYCNAVCKVRTDLVPDDLLRILQRIEDAAGRDRTAAHWGPRTLDLDLLLHGDAVLDTPALKLPHPEIARRNFVLAPLAELEPSLVIPGHGTVSALLQAVGRAGLGAWPE